jgi:hypothetical protein
MPELGSLKMRNISSFSLLDRGSDEEEEEEEEEYSNGIFMIGEIVDCAKDEEGEDEAGGISVVTIILGLCNVTLSFLAGVALINGVEFIILVVVVAEGATAGAVVVVVVVVAVVVEVILAVIEDGEVEIDGESKFTNIWRINVRLCGLGSVINVESNERINVSGDE